MKKLIASMGSALMLFSIGASSASAIIPPILNCHTLHSCGVYVDASAAPAGDGSFAHPFQKITDAVNYLETPANSDYDNIWVAGGNYSAETLPWNVDGSTYSKSFNLSGGWNSAFSTQAPSSTPSNIQTGGAAGLLDVTSVAGKMDGFDISGLNGGGIFIQNNGATTLDFSVTNNVIHNNITTSAVALAIIITGSNTAEVSANKFYSNTANGGLVSNYNGKVTAYNNLYYANSSNGGGGSLKCSNGALVYNNFILGDTADALVIPGGSCQFVNNTLAHNQINSGASNAAIVALGNGNTIDNNLIAYTVGNSTLVHNGGDTSVFDYNALFSNSSDPAMSGNNLSCDPQFSGSGTDPNSYKLASGSTCIDKGTTESGVANDYFGTARPLDGDGNGTAQYDPGAFEAAAASVSAPSITGLSAAPATISPNGDGNADTTTISFNLSANANVTVSILNGSSVEMKRLIDNQSKSTGSILTTWDGKDTTGNVVADGVYTAKVTATNAGGTDSKSTNVTVSVGSVTPPPPPSGSQCDGFTDVPSTDPDCAAFTYVKGSGAMTGNPDGTFAPNADLQRDQVAKIVLTTFNKFNASTDYCHSVNPFPDVTPVSWAFQYVCDGKGIGMITGYQSGADAGFYRPGRAVDRVEFLALLLRNLSDPMPSNSSLSYADVAAGQWFSGYAKYSMDNSLFVGADLFPTQYTLRREVAEIIYKLHTLGKF